MVVPCVSCRDMGLQLFKQHVATDVEIERKVVQYLLQLIEAERCD